jgi:hypothetical protein
LNCFQVWTWATVVLSRACHMSYNSPFILGWEKIQFKNFQSNC